MKSTLRCMALLSTLLAAGAGQAADEEIQVYTDDLRAPGVSGVDVHNNYVFSGRREAEYPGERPPGKVYRLTPEFTYGWTKTLELGLYILGSRDADGTLRGDGAKVRLKFIPEHDTAAGAYWGANLEVGRTVTRVAPLPWNAQLKGIAGWRGGAWHVAVNPNLDWSLSQGGGPVGLSIDAKAAYSIDEKTQLGLESYNELGPLRRIEGWNRNPKTLYAVVDHDFGSVDLNAGIGRGLSSQADRWTLKFIVGVDF